MKLFCLVAAAAAVSAAPLLHAETPSTDTVIVTATRTAQTADESLASVTVITREDIERNQAMSVSELLTGMAGIDSAVNGGYGKTTGLFMRGANSDHVLVMIDGIKVGSASLGMTSFEFLPLSQIERIEIVRGPRSSLYGSEAIGGVIQIFTRKGSDKSEAHTSVTAGSYNTRAVSAGMSSSTPDSTGLSMTAARFKTGGFNACKGSFTDACLTVEPDKDGYRNDSATARLSHRFDSNTDIDIHLLRAQGHTDYDGNSQNKTNFIQQAVGTDLNFSPLNNWQVKLRTGQSQDNTDNFKDRTFSSNFDTQRDVASWQNDVSLGRNLLLTLGADRQTDRLISSTPFSVDQRRDKAFFGQIQNRFDNNDFLLALRQDDNDTFGKYHTGNIAWGYAFSERMRLTASYGTAFKAPTFNQLYWPLDTVTICDIVCTTYISSGNPNVQPEKSRSSEIGFSYRSTERTRFSINAFQTDVKNLIDWSTSLTAPDTYTTMPQNIARARIDGVETQVAINLAGWATSAAYTWLDPRDLGTNHVLARRSKQTLKLDMDRGFGKTRFGITWLAQSRRYEYNPDTIVMGGYGLLNLRTQYDLSKNWALRAHLDNVLDKQYETAHNYNTPGRSLFVSLNYQAR